MEIEICIHINQIVMSHRGALPQQLIQPLHRFVNFLNPPDNPRLLDWMAKLSQRLPLHVKQLVIPHPTFKPLLQRNSERATKPLKLSSIIDHQTWILAFQKIIQRNRSEQPIGISLNPSRDIQNIFKV